MPRPPSDTSPEADALVIAGLRRMSGAQRLKHALDLSRLTAELALADIRQRHPHASERECLLRLALRTIDDPVVRRDILEPELAKVQNQ